MTPSIARWLRAGTLTAVVDAIFSSVLVTVFYGSTVGRLWRGVASVAFGEGMLAGGVPAALAGLVLHVGVAFGWSAVFLFGVVRLAWVRRRLATWRGAFLVATLYGPCIWIAMSGVVIPLFTAIPPTPHFRWWVQLIGHVPFVALPIVAVARADGTAGRAAPRA